jgi:hypothetical protein
MIPLTVFTIIPEYDGYKRLIMLLIGKPKLDYPKTDFTQGNLFAFDKKNDIIRCSRYY